MKPPKCLSAADWTGHCLHFAPGWPREDENERTLTCCDCGLEWTTEGFNRMEHGPHRTGRPMERVQHIWTPDFRIVGNEPPDRLDEQETT